VMGHEFSHILNGDMQLNLRLMGIIFGILCLEVIGRSLLYVRGGSRDRNPLLLLGLVLLLLGWIGVLFGRLIQSAVSRQREFLADAAAVQFTRNPAGLSGALQRIGAAQHGSRLRNEHATEASHLFFGDAMSNSLFNAFATHPPLIQRIRAIDPHWDGKFPAPRPTKAEKTSTPARPVPRAGPPPLLPGHPGRAGNLIQAATVIQAAAVLPNLGNPTPLHLRYAEAVRGSIPDAVQEAARSPGGACAVLYGLLISPDASLRQHQLEELTRRTHPDVSQQVRALLPSVTALARTARLPLLNLTLTALRQLRAAEYAEFELTLNWLIDSDQQLNLFEFVLQRIIRRQVASQFVQSRPAAVQYYSINPLLPDCELLLSALAHAGQSEPEAARRAFAAGAPHLRSRDRILRLRSRPECDLRAIDMALERLPLAAPQIKKNLLQACIQVVGADGVIHEIEAELLRGIAETVDCPIPPFVVTE